MFSLYEETMQIPGQLTPRRIVHGNYIRSYLCESEPTALCVANIPTHSDASLYSKFRYNGYIIITGHTNGFINIWWGGNIPTIDINNQPVNKAASENTSNDNKNVSKATKATVSVPKGSKISKANAANGTKVVPPVLPPVSSTSSITSSISPNSLTMESVPIASYPPFHASRGAIMHISPAFCIETGTEHRKHVQMFQSLTGTSTVLNPATKIGSNLSTIFCVGAYGARGWRVFELPHLLIPSSPVPRTTSSKKSNTLSTPDLVRGTWSYDQRGRKIFVPPAPADVSHLLQPLVTCPTYTDCMRSPVIGDAQWKSTSHNPLSSTASLTLSSSVETGIDPRGAVLLQRYPSADTTSLPSYATEGSTADDSYGSYTSTVNSLYPGLPPTTITPDKSVFRLMARNVTGIQSEQSVFANNDNNEETNKEILHDGFPHLPSGNVMQVPRTIVLLLTERGLHAAGFDHGPSLVADIKPNTMAAHARGIPIPELSSSPTETKDIPVTTTTENILDKFPEKIPPLQQHGTRDIWADEPVDNQNNITTNTIILNLTANTATSSINRGRKLKNKEFHPHSKPQWPMAITGRHDSFIRGLRATFDIEESEELLKKRSSSKEHRSIEQEKLSTTQENIVPPNIEKDTTKSKVNTITIKKAPTIAVTPPPVPVVKVLTEQELKYMPRHTAERLLAKQKKQQQQLEKKQPSEGEQVQVQQ